MDDKRAAILTASLDLISERGFHNTPVSLISQEAGVSAGIIYHYFDNKEDLIDELYKKAKLDLVRAMLEGYAEVRQLLGEKKAAQNVAAILLKD